MNVDIIKNICELQRESLVIYFESGKRKGLTHFGGMPDVPKNFEWPIYKDYVLDEIYPINFIAQFECKELNRNLSKDVFPEKGILSFFYDAEGQPEEGISIGRSCVKVYWFENIDQLIPAEIDEGSCFPYLSIKMESEKSYPSWEDYSIMFGKKTKEERYNYCDLMNRIKCKNVDGRSKILGWPDIMQNNMIRMCERLYRNDKISKKKTDLNEWQLLLQMSSIVRDDFDLLFGDRGNLYFYVRKEDLLKNKFDNVCAILQCG